MSVDQIKQEITVLTEPELNEVTAFLFHLRHRHDADYQRVVASRLNDQNRSNWLTVEEFESELERR